MSDSLVVDLCVVSFGDECHIEAATSRLRKQNPRINFNVILVNNHEKAIEKADQIGCVAVLDGPQRTQNKTSDSNPSWLHGEALNLAFEHSRARYVLVMDPDFYVAKKEGVSDAIDYMKSCGLSLFGVPWHPKWWTKPRGQIAPHFMLFDTDRLDKKAVNFTPRLQYPKKRSIVAQICDSIFKRSFFKRFTIGRDEDTGSRIRPDTVSATGGVFLLDPFVSEADIRLPVLSRLLDRVLPNSLSFYPHTGCLVADQNFQMSELSARGFESFLWKGDLFGIHVRGHPKRYHRDKISEVKEIMSLLSDFDNR